jgi:phage terminase large subunit-like protein
MGLRGPGAGRAKAARAAVKAKPSKPKWERKGLSRAERVIVFLETLPITSGPLAGTKMKLRPWQREIIEAIFAVNEHGHRKVRTALITMPRKQGKSQLAAGLELAFLLGPEAESRGQCYSASADRNMAGLIFNEMEAIILAVPEFAARCNIQRFHKKIEDTKTGSIYAALSADAKKAHGLNVSFACVDELAQLPNRNLYDNLVTGTGGRAEPLVVVISTQSADPLHIMSELVDYGRQVNDGSMDDPTFHATIYAADEDDDPWDEATWYKCNPALGDFRSLDEMRAAAMQAQRLPAREPAFRNLYLNMRIEAEERFIRAAEWDACNTPVDIASLKGRRCFGGLDLGSTRDLSCLTLAFPDDEGAFDIVPFFWVPRDNMLAREEIDKVPYWTWANAKPPLIESAPGAAMDYSFIVHRLGELAAMFQIEAVAFDRWRIEDVKRMLVDEGIDIKLVEFGQGYQSMAPAVDFMETLIIQRKLRHGGHPVLRWNARNAVVTRDAAGNRKLDKERSREKIDGLVSTAMACAMARRDEDNSLPACLLAA